MQSKEHQMLSTMFCTRSFDWENVLMFFNSFTWTSEYYDSEKTASSTKMIRRTWRCMFCTKDMGESSVSSPYRVQIDCFQTHEELVISDKWNPAPPFVKACATRIDSSCSQKNIRCCQQCFVLDLVTSRMPSCFSIHSHGRRSVMTVKRRLQAKKWFGGLEGACSLPKTLVEKALCPTPCRVQIISRLLKKSWHLTN